MATQRETDLASVEEANNIEEGLSDWEVEFIESLNKWLKGNDTLTPKQRAKLESILTAKG
jgi:hypothetical protein